MTVSIETTQKRRLSVFAIALVIPWIAVVRAAYGPIRDNSFLWHIRAGELQSDAGAVLTADPFSIGLNGEPWITQSWLAELLYAWGEGLFGLGYVAPMLIVCTTITFVGIGLIAYRRSDSTVSSAVVLILSTVLLAAFLVPRPVVMSFPLFVLVILAWENCRMRWALPFLFWMWASVHGSFAIGLIWIGLSLIAERDWKALRIAIASGLVTLLTAHGLGVVSMLLEFAGSSDYLDLISEWATPDLISLSLLPYFLGILIIVVGAMRGRLRPASLWVIAPFLALGFTAVRAVPPAWLGLVPYVALSLEGVQFARLRGFARPVGIAIVVLVISMPAVLLAGPPEFAEDRFPEAAASRMQHVPTFHDDVAGGYLIWKYGPELSVFIDDRAEFFKERIREYADVRDGREPWQPVFERDGIEQALLRAEQPMVDDLRAAGWDTVYSDNAWVLLRPGSA